jgi:hypothetical protein
MPFNVATNRALSRGILNAVLVIVLTTFVWSVWDHVSPAGADGRGGGRRNNAIVMATLRGDDNEWLDQVLPGWERFVYVVDAKEGERLGKGLLRVPKNKGREAMVFLR